jgi:hypothetical protein
MTDQPVPDRTTDQPPANDDDTPAPDEPPPQQPADPAPPRYGDEVDDAAADSFPASDPPSFTGSSSTRDPESR